jgi:hypothetical protein
MATRMATPAERSIGDVMTDVAGNVERLVRTEVQLARATLLEEIQQMAAGSAWVVGGALLATLSLLLLLLGAVAKLSEWMAMWQATLVVAGGAALAAAIAISVGMRALGSRTTDGET